MKLVPSGLAWPEVLMKCNKFMMCDVRKGSLCFNLLGRRCVLHALWKEAPSQDLDKPGKQYDWTASQVMQLKRRRIRIWKSGGWQMDRWGLTLNGLEVSVRRWQIPHWFLLSHTMKCVFCFLLSWTEKANANANAYKLCNKLLQDRNDFWNKILFTFDF